MNDGSKNWFVLKRKEMAWISKNEIMEMKFLRKVKQVILREQRWNEKNQVRPKYFCTKQAE